MKATSDISSALIRNDRRLNGAKSPQEMADYESTHAALVDAYKLRMQQSSTSLGVTRRSSGLKVKATSGGVNHQFRQNAIDKEINRHVLAAAIHT